MSGRCDYCGRPPEPGTERWALVPDSSFVHPSDPALDGRRVVTACGTEHLEELIKRARREWTDEQLWLGQLARASVKPGLRGASLRKVAYRARLSPEQLHRTLDWNAGRTAPDTTLPGGQSLPVAQRRGP